MSVSGPVPRRARVLIIGGGFAGAATAYELARSGVDDIVVVERESTCGVHASGRNAAMGRQLTEHDGFTGFTVAGAEFLRRPPPDFTDTPLLSNCGSVLLVDRPDELDAMVARALRWELPHERVDSAEIQRRLPVLDRVPGAGGIRFPSDGVIDVHALLHGFLHGARARGARIEVDCEVLGLHYDARDRTARALTRRGEIHARIVVNAAGAWVGEVGALTGARPTAFAALRRHLFITEAVPGLDVDAPFVWHVGAREFYVRPERTGYLLSGCDEDEMPPCDAVPAADAVDSLAAKLIPLAPRLGDLGIARVWACLRTFTPDRQPFVGWDPENPWLFWVAGLGGHGATASAAIGRHAAGSIRTRLADGP